MGWWWGKAAWRHVELSHVASCDSISIGHRRRADPRHVPCTQVLVERPRPREHGLKYARLGSRAGCRHHGKARRTLMSIADATSQEVNSWLKECAFLKVDCDGGGVGRQTSLEAADLRRNRMTPRNALTWKCDPAETFHPLSGWSNA